MKKFLLSFVVAVLMICTISFNQVVNASSENATRVEVIVEIGKLLDLDNTRRTTVFKDVPKSHYASGYIQSAVDVGIVSGYTDGTFKPNGHLTRGHFALFITRAFGDQLPKERISFRDISYGDLYYDAVSRLVAANITKGYPDGSFQPNTTLTKEHLKLFIDRTINYIDSNKVEEKNYDDSLIKLGASYSSVYSYFEGSIIKSIPNTLIQTNRARYGLMGSSVYTFDSKNKLGIFFHEFDWRGIENLPNRVSLIHNLYVDYVTNEFGEPNFNSSDIVNQKLKYHTSWTLPNLYVMLETTKVSEDDLEILLSIFDGK